MKNEHLIPPIVMDIGNSLLAESTRHNERANYYSRIAAIRQYCEQILLKADKFKVK